uniref:Ovule protein n=1 Tax=Parascaris equorum TaxID=6256 RepID=A0A914RDH1_PAREQ
MLSYVKHALHNCRTLHPLLICHIDAFHLFVLIQLLTYFLHVFFDCLSYSINGVIKQKFFELSNTTANCLRKQNQQ